MRWQPQMRIETILGAAIAYTTLAGIAGTTAIPATISDLPTKWRRVGEIEGDSHAQ